MLISDLFPFYRATNGGSLYTQKVKELSQTPPTPLLYQIHIDMTTDTVPVTVEFSYVSI